MESEGNVSGSTEAFWSSHKISQDRDQPGNPTAQGEGRASHKSRKLTAEKAKTILKDDSVRGHPLSSKQKRFFGAIAGGEKPYKK